MDKEFSDEKKRWLKMAGMLEALIQEHPAIAEKLDLSDAHYAEIGKTLHLMMKAMGLCK